MRVVYQDELGEDHVKLKKNISPDKSSLIFVCFCMFFRDIHMSFQSLGIDIDSSGLLPDDAHGPDEKTGTDQRQSNAGAAGGVFVGGVV